jgi:hypothetical protein
MALSFFVDGTPSGKPACARVAYWMIRDENSAAGKRLIAALMAAKAAQRPIHVNGSNTCQRWPDGEDVESITWND